jgi:hypothetical protein
MHFFGSKTPVLSRRRPVGGDCMTSAGRRAHMLVDNIVALNFVFVLALILCSLMLNRAHYIRRRFGLNDARWIYALLVYRTRLRQFQHEVLARQPEESLVLCNIATT